MKYYCSLESNVSGVLNSFDYCVIDKAKTVLEKNQGRDKVCKVVQYTAKLAIAFHSPSKQYVGVLAKQLSATRRILRTFKFLSFPQDMIEVLETQNPIERYPGIVETIAGTCSEIADDVCWAADMQILPQWIGEHDIWADYLWFVELCFNLPFTAWKVVRKRRALKQVEKSDEQKDAEWRKKRRRAQAVLLLAQLNLMKRIADFFHACRLAFNWQL